MKNNFLFMFAIFVGLIACNQTSENVSSSENTVEKRAENLTTINIKVKGMTCTGCEQTIVKKLENKDGVQSAEASHEHGTAKVTFNENELSKEEVAEVIEKTGYNVEEMNRMN